MTAFTDTFARANGPIGANWYNPSGYLTIASNRPAAAVPSYAPCLAFSDAGPHDATVTLDTAIAGYAYNGPMVKLDATGTGGYLLQLLGTSGAYTATISYLSGGLVTIATGLYSSTVPTLCPLRLVYSGGTLQGYVNGVLVVWGRDSRFGANTRTGVRFYGAYAGAVAGFTIAATETAAFACSPNWAPTSGAPVLLSLTGTATAWTAGSPGTPTFSVNAGSLAGQAVGSPTTATVWFTPPTTDQTVTITDPSTGLTAPIIIAATAPPPGGGGGEDTWAPYAALVEATGTLFAPDYLLTDQSPVIEASEEVPSRLPILDAIRQIWNAHFGGWTGEAPPSDSVFAQLLIAMMGSSTPTVELYNAARATSLREESEAIRDSLTALRAPIDWTLAGILNVIVGEDSVSTTAIKDAIDGLSAGSNQDVLDALTAYFGESPPTIEQLGTMVSDLATIAGYTLGDVHDWIDAIPPTDLSPILDKLGPSSSTIEARIDALSDLIVTETTIQGMLDILLTAIGGSVGTIVGASEDAIIDAIGGIQPGGGVGAPLWPGEANVTMGEPVALSNGVVVEGPMHGVIVTLTAHPPGAGVYGFGTMRSWGHAGACAFEDDAGHFEWPISLGPETQVITPRSMQVATSAVLRVGGGYQGTVTPWLISGG